jgi:acyl dehydratase
MKIGEFAITKKTFNKSDVFTFASISLDNNPLHLNEEYARKTPFKKPIVHGFLVGSLISATIANKLPGIGSIYLSQSMDFKLPVFIGDTVRAVVTITNIKKEKIFYFDTKCYNQNDELVIQGEAVILKHL